MQKLNDSYVHENNHIIIILQNIVDQQLVFYEISMYSIYMHIMSYLSTLKETYRIATRI